jgi:hypothetical protein
MNESHGYPIKELGYDKNCTHKNLTGCYWGWTYSLLRIFAFLTFEFVSSFVLQISVFPTESNLKAASGGASGDQLAWVRPLGHELQWV